MIIWPSTRLCKVSVNDALHQCPPDIGGHNDPADRQLPEVWQLIQIRPLICQAHNFEVKIILHLWMQKNIVNISSLLYYSTLRSPCIKTMFPEKLQVFLRIENNQFVFSYWIDHVLFLLRWCSTVATHFNKCIKTVFRKYTNS